MIARVSIGIALLWCSNVWAADPILDVKLGQWETTSSIDSTGRPPIPPEILARMTPDQRAKMEASMKAYQAPKTTTTKSCVKKEDLTKAFMPGDEKNSCTRTIIASSPTKQEVRVECTSDKMKSSGTVRVEAPNPETVKGSMMMAVTGSGQTMNINTTFSSKWIGPACAESKGR